MIELENGFIESATPRFVDMGGVLEAELGGEDQRLDRLGSRWALEVQLKPMRAPDAQRWISRLTRGMSEGVKIEFPQADFKVLTGAGTVDGTLAASVNSNSTSLAFLSNGGAAQAGKTFYEGQFFTINESTTDRNLHQVSEDVTLDVNGAGVIKFWPPARRNWPSAKNVSFSIPQIMGFVRSDGHLPWTIDVARIYGLGFTVQETT